MTGVSKRNLVVVAVAAVVILGGILAVAQFGSSVRAHAVSAREPARCSVATLKGTYVWSAHGEVPGTRGAKRPFAVSGVQVFDARGHAHGFYSQSMDGKISRRVRFTAKYALHGDCTGTYRATDPTGNVRQSDLYSVPSGIEVGFVATDPGVVLSGVAEARKVE
ncbi:MAG: hypothetical protein ACM3ZF_16520 [Mycobacterium leprae]